MRETFHARTVHGIVAVTALLIVSWPLGAAFALEQIYCPVNEVTTEITTPIPSPWWQTPQGGGLVETRIEWVGGEPTLMCLYGAYGTTVAVMHLAPNADCQAVTGGFECPDGYPPQMQGGGQQYAPPEPEPPLPSSPELSCYQEIQGRIAWSYLGTTSWASENVEDLCRGTSEPSEPGRCFDRVMHGGVNWGGGTEWEWQDVLQLCQGANNAQARIDCFQARIRNGENWQSAINACASDSYGPGAGSSQDRLPSAQTCHQEVQGKIAWDYRGSTSWSPENVERLCGKTSAPSEPGSCFNHVMHGGINYGGGTQWQWQNAIHLCQGTSNGKARIDCFQKRIGNEGWKSAIEVCSQLP